MAREQQGFSIKGKIYEIFETKLLTEKFRKREIIIEYTPNIQYPQYIKLDLQNDNCNLVDGFNIHDEVEVFFDLRGKPYTTKTGETTYFTNLVVWRIVKLNSSQPDNDIPLPTEEPVSDDPNDLPF
jgi:hypothetical protein